MSTDNHHVNPFSFPNGHLGHLNPEQASTFKQFKGLLEERAVYKSNTGDGVPSESDTTLL